MQNKQATPSKSLGLNHYTIRELEVRSIYKIYEVFTHGEGMRHCDSFISGIKGRWIGQKVLVDSFASIKFLLLLVVRHLLLVAMHLFLVASN